MTSSPQVSSDNWLNGVYPGAQVWWNDPDNGAASGYYIVVAIDSDSGGMNENTVLQLKNVAGSETEAFAGELASMQPEGLYPVVDGDSGDIDWYGYASSKEEAIEVINSMCCTDEFVDAFLAENHRTEDGTYLEKAWVATTTLVDRMTVRLTLDVTYSLNGEQAADLVARLRAMCERAIGDGGLTGGTSAEVDDYAISTNSPEANFALRNTSVAAHDTIADAVIPEDDIAEFMLQRIESGNLPLEQIPDQLARYGLMPPNEFMAEMRERMGSDE